MVEVTKSIAGAGLKITPDVVVGGGGAGDSNGGLVQLLLANMIREQRLSVPVAAAAPVEAKH
jgi:hypothetical protein